MIVEEDAIAMRPDEAVIVNALVRQAFVSAQEVMGENGLNAVLRASGLERFIGNFSPNDTRPGIKTVEYARFNEAICHLPGPSQRPAGLPLVRRLD